MYARQLYCICVSRGLWIQAARMSWNGLVEGGDVGDISVLGYNFTYMDEEKNLQVVDISVDLRHTRCRTYPDSHPSSQLVPCTKPGRLEKRVQCLRLFTINSSPSRRASSYNTSCCSLANTLQRELYKTLLLFLFLDFPFLIYSNIM
jgi:hypothetical protein